MTLLNQLETDVNVTYGEYVSVSRTYGDFLTATNTENSLHEKSNLKTQLEPDKTKVVDFCQLIADAKGKLLEHLMNKSIRSVSHQSERSRASKVTSELLVIKYAEARVRMEIVEMEAEILKQKAKWEESGKIILAAATRQKIELDADLNVHSLEKKAAPTTA